MVLGKLPVPGRPTHKDKSRAGAYCACSRDGRNCLDSFSLVFHFSFFFISLGDGLIYTEILSQRTIKLNQPTNQHQLVCGRPTLGLSSALVPHTFSCSVCGEDSLPINALS